MVKLFVFVLKHLISCGFNFSVQKPKFTHRLQNLVSDYLFVFTYIHPHFRIILQRRSAYCKKNHVIWTRMGKAM
ncbi:hypothetical protein K443DRAFT_113486 [Laccaria amethystina LaAM-08-1]|uniref:Uncharacterized protein n=1 Tax=Laccaria amethystina LaAM-08-1 TaxID=1095629 RepID=A0A0C9X830_9AGAR|nr:hypothetical protein K443DRAFT_113486 [Laccaria amethystina LaAM-08-1]